MVLKRKINTESDLNIEIKRFIGQFCLKFKADCATFHIYNPKEDHFYEPVYTGKLSKNEYLSPSKKGSAYKILMGGKPRFTSSALNDYKFRGRFTLLENIKSGAAFPYKSKFNPSYHSILFVNYRKPQNFSINPYGFTEIAMIEKAEEIQSEIEKSISDELIERIFRNPIKTREHYEIQVILERYKVLLKDEELLVWEKRSDNDISLIGFISNEKNREKYLYNLNLDSIEAEESKLVSKLFEDCKSHEINNFPISLISDNEENGKVLIPYLINNSYLFIVIGKKECCKDKLETYSLIKHQINDLFISQSRILALDNLSMIGNWLNVSEENKDNFLNNMIESLATVLDADHVVLHLYDVEKKEFKDPKKYSIAFPKQVRGNLFKPRVHGASSYILNQGLLVVEDIENSETKFDPLNERIKSYIGLRLEAEHQVYGVLYIDYYYTRSFNAEELFIADMYSDYLASILNTNNLIEELQTTHNDNKKKNEELNNTIGDFRKIISVMENIQVNSSEDNPFKVINYLKDQVKYIFNADQVDIIEFDNKYQEFFRRNEFPADNYSRVLKDFSTSMLVIKRGEIIFENDVENPSLLPKFETSSDTKSIGAKSLVAAPLVIGENPIGIMWVDYTQKKHLFSEREKFLVKILTNYISFYLYSYQLINEKNVDLKGIFKCMDFAEDSRNLTSLLTNFEDLLLSETNADYCAIFTYDESRNKFIKQCERAKYKINNPDGMNNHFLDKNFFIEKFITEFLDSIYIKDVDVEFSDEDSYLYEVLLPGSKSRFIIPIRIENKLLGLIILEACEKDFLSVQERQLSEILAKTISVLFRDRKTLDKTYELNKELEVEKVLDEIGISLVHKTNNDLGMAKNYIMRIEEHINILNDTNEYKEETMCLLNTAKYLIADCISNIKKIASPANKEMSSISLDSLLKEAIKTYNKTPNYYDGSEKKSKLKILYKPEESGIDLKVKLRNKDMAILHILELFNNAQKAFIENIGYENIEKGLITVSCSRKNESACVRISNNGGAIPEDKWELVFNLYNGTQSNNNNGFGMGLYLARKYFSNNSANIYLVTPNERDETSFEILFNIGDE